LWLWTPRRIAAGGMLPLPQRKPPEKGAFAMPRPNLKANTGGRWHLDAQYVRIVWAPIAAFIFIEVLVGIFSQSPDMNFDTLEKATFPVWAEAAARLQFFGLFILFLMFTVGVVLKFGYDAIYLFDRKSCERLFVAFTLCAAAGALIIFSALVLHILPQSKEYFGAPLFEHALKKAHDYKGIGTLQWKVFWGKDTFWWFMLVVNVAVGSAVPAFIAGGISCLGTRQDSDPKQHWILQRERLQTYIYLSAALLVIAVVFLKVWTQYPAFTLTKDAAAAYNSVVNSYAVLTGIEYTVLLASYALPVSLFLSQQADQIAQEILDGAKSKDALTIRDVREKEKLTISSRDVLKSIIALLSPLITGSIATLASVAG
jgi:hypothetical protein